MLKLQLIYAIYIKKIFRMYKMDIYKQIPLINDIITCDSNVKLDDLYTHLDYRMLDMFCRFNVRPSDEEICNYIKFINKTAMGPQYYKDIIKFIDENNIDKVLNLFTNNDIREELFPLIPYELASKVWDVDNLDELWLINNKEWMFANINNHDVSRHIIETCIDKYNYTYYCIYGEVFTLTHDEVKESQEYVSDMEIAAIEESYTIVKYILEKINKSKERMVGEPIYEFHSYYKNTMYIILDHQHLDEIMVDIIKLLLLNVKYVDMAIMFEYILNKNYGLFRFLYGILLDYLEENGIPTNWEEINIQNSEYKRLMKNRKHDIEVKETDTLHIVIEDHTLEEIINLILGGAKMSVLDISYIVYLSQWYMSRWYLNDINRKILLDNCVMTKM